MITSPIRVLLVDDSPVALAVLHRMLATAPEITVVGMARNGQEALQLIPRLQPDVICTDLHMPVMDGLALTRAVMARFPRPILVVSVSVQHEDAAQVFRLLQSGAVDVFPKPRQGLDTASDALAQELIRKIKILAHVVVFHRHQRGTVMTASQPQPLPAGHPSSPPQIVVIGASTGGPQALHTILSQLPADFPVPILCVQHISRGFLPGLIQWLAAQCLLPVTLARHGELLCPGKVVFAPEGAQLQVQSSGRLCVTAALPYQGYCPSVTVTMRAVAAQYGQSTVGVLLTGMGSDGAEGMQAIAEAGGITIAQDEATSVVFGMPKQAIARGAAQYVLPVTRIASTLRWLCMTKEGVQT